jgi:hypothetical protein
MTDKERQELIDALKLLEGIKRKILDVLKNPQGGTK